MTATTVNGHMVVSNDPTLSPIKARDGQPVYWQQTRTLTLDDDTVVYGCAHCDYVSEKPHAIRPHLNSHRTRGATRSSPARGSALAALAAELAKVEEDRDRWRTRARRAERDLATIRRAIGGAP